MNITEIKMIQILTKIQKFVKKSDIYKMLRTALIIQIALVVTQYHQLTLLIIVFGKIQNANKLQHKKKQSYMIKLNNGIIYMITFAKIHKDYANLILLMLHLQNLVLKNRVFLFQRIIFVNLLIFYQVVIGI